LHPKEKSPSTEPRPLFRVIEANNEEFFAAFASTYRSFCLFAQVYVYQVFVLTDRLISLIVFFLLCGRYPKLGRRGFLLWIMVVCLLTLHPVHSATFPLFYKAPYLCNSSNASDTTGNSTVFLGETLLLSLPGGLVENAAEMFVVVKRFLDLVSKRKPDDDWTFWGIVLKALCGTGFAIFCKIVWCMIFDNRKEIHLKLQNDGNEEIIFFCRPIFFSDEIDVPLDSKATCPTGRSWIDLLRLKPAWQCCCIPVNKPITMTIRGEEIDSFRVFAVIDETPLPGGDNVVLCAESSFFGNSQTIKVEADAEAKLFLRIGNSDEPMTQMPGKVRDTQKPNAFALPFWLLLSKPVTGHV
jgi:hypothetical protein